MGSSLTYLNLGSNALTSLPTEIGALTGLEVLDLVTSALTSVPRRELEGSRSNSRDGLGGGCGSMRPGLELARGRCRPLGSPWTGEMKMK